LNIVSKIELPPDNRSDEVTLQVVKCASCGFQAVAIYEESRRGTLGTESWNHTGFRVAKNTLAAIRKTIKQCPNPTHCRCQCPAHHLLTQLFTSGTWQGVNTLNYGNSFSMKLASSNQG